MITASDILGARIPCFPTPRSGSKDRRAATGRWPAYTNDCWPAPEFLVSGAPVLPSGDRQLSASSRRSAGEVERRQRPGPGFPMGRCKLTLAGGAIEPKVSFLARPRTYGLGHKQ